jgi:5-formyltetrahydrofolate cyclo-ligase
MPNILFSSNSDLSFSSRSGAPSSSPSGRKGWRAALRERRRAVTAAQAQQAAAAIAHHLSESPLWQSQTIGCYVANDGEIDPTAIAVAAHAAGKTLYLPVIETAGKMHFAAWSPEETLRPNHLGIGEPVDKSCRRVKIDLLLMPLVGWTGQGFRLGMGGGYYDRFLASSAARGTFRLGLAYECQHETALDALKQEWDAPLDGVLTERGLLRFD